MEAEHANIVEELSRGMQSLYLERHEVYKEYFCVAM